LVATVRGRRGGCRLARPAGEISIGDVVRVMESSHKASGDQHDKVAEEAFEKAWGAMWKAMDAVTLAAAG
jgi:DNA-binding IscR family transcriptional regulator